MWVDERAVRGPLVGLGALTQLLNLVQDEFEALLGVQHVPLPQSRTAAGNLTRAG
jgi:hypothetical protein